MSELEALQADSKDLTSMDIPILVQRFNEAATVGEVDEIKKEAIL
jgi:hypothetical protein